MARKPKYYDPNEESMEVQMDAIRAKRKRAGPRIALAFLIILALVMGTLAVSVAVRGKRMSHQAEVYTPHLNQPGQEDRMGQFGDVDGDVITYKGKQYRHNDDVATFLLLGIDRNDPDSFDPGNCQVMAFSDAVVLAAMDFKNERITFFTVSRDTMCTFNKLSKTGEVVEEAVGQLAIPFSYGDGREKSLENTKDAVSGLFDNLPIYSCSALYMEGFNQLNDIIGGVTLTPIETVDWGDVHLEEGEEVTLNSDEAEAYIRYREHTEQGNLIRMERQKHYVKTLVTQVLKACKKNIHTVIQVYNAISDNVVTDLKLSDILYLATKATKMKVTSEIKSVPGSVTLSEDNYAEFYIDQEGCFELLLSIYYEEVS